MSLNQQKQVKSKQRVQDHGEVFTAEREVNAMCDLVADECRNIDATFLEPACGDGNFLAEILRRKLSRVKEMAKSNREKYSYDAIRALASLYGVDILSDNAAECRRRLFAIWDEAYTAFCKKDAEDAVREAARHILATNIICGNALTLMQVDDQQQDTANPIAFAEWSFANGYVNRSDYRMDVLLKENPDTSNYDIYPRAEQMSLFADDAMGYQNWGQDEENKVFSRPMATYSRVYYKSLGKEVRLNG